MGVKISFNQNTYSREVLYWISLSQPVWEDTMVFRLVEGEVALGYQGQRRVGSQPDGDSVWFKPDNPNHLRDIGGRDASFNGGEFANLRFEGIDALELHYKGGHQLEEPTVRARDFVLDALGFTSVTFVNRNDPDEIDMTVHDATPETVRAHIFTRAVDPFGRPVAFVFAGTHPRRNGTEFFVEVDEMAQSINAGLMDAGLVYPAYYSSREINGVSVGGLPGSIRRILTARKGGAQAQNRGVWAHDASLSGFQANNSDDLDDLAIWPKLYRRMHTFFRDQSVANHTMAAFVQWLQDNASSRDDRVFVLETGEMRNLSDVLNRDGTQLRLIHDPDQLIIVPR
jgi:hypothetical protein